MSRLTCRLQEKAYHKTAVIKPLPSCTWNSPFWCWRSPLLAVEPAKLSVIQSWQPLWGFPDLIFSEQDAFNYNELKIKDRSSPYILHSWITLSGLALWAKAQVAAMPANLESLPSAGTWESSMVGASSGLKCTCCSWHGFAHLLVKFSCSSICLQTKATLPMQRI